MLVSFESKSSRVKGLSFHPKRPWILASLHSGAIQLLDYRLATVIDTYHEHDGPVRGIAFHPTQPLFVSGGDDAKIKVFHYGLRRCLFTLTGHADYIRTVQFHHELPWIVSASDDQTVRVWNWQNRTCLAVLSGHNHYVMCASFHPTEDLVVSASLDQTIRVWDVSGLGGGSANAAQAIAAVTAAGLWSSSVAPSGQEPIGGGAAWSAPGPLRLGPGAGSVNTLGLGGSSSAGLGSNAFGGSSGAGGISGVIDRLGGSLDVAVKFTLEGHTRGVNWASFHPTLPLIASGADDRTIKLWRYTESRAWEVDTLRGHVNNVSCVLFHPHLDVIVSNSEDKTIRVWDLVRRSCVAVFRREMDRFWILAMHPHLNIMAAGHDSGCMVFKLQRERPPFAMIEGGVLVYVRDRLVRALQLDTGREWPVCVARGRLPAGDSGTPWPHSSGNGSMTGTSLGTNLSSSGLFGLTTGSGMLAPPPRIVQYQPLEKTLLLQYDADGGFAELYACPGRIEEPRAAAADGQELQIEPRRVSALSSVLLGRNRWLTLEDDALVMRETQQNSERRIALPAPAIRHLFPAAAGLILLATREHVLLWDWQRQKVLATLDAPLVQYAVWSEDRTHVALLSKHTLWVADRNLERLAYLHETMRIKSAAWDESGVLLYTTMSHLKYCLPNGDAGIVCTLREPLYLTWVRGPAVAALDRRAQPQTLAIDPAEYTFKLLLWRQSYDRVRQALAESRLPGKSIISYLQQKGHLDIALWFADEPQTRFVLALQAGYLDTALEMARQLDDDDAWSSLAQKAMEYGQVRLAEFCYQRLKDLERLLFLYLITGNWSKLERLEEIAESQKDLVAQLQIALVLGDVPSRIQVLETAGLDTLASLTKMTFGSSLTQNNETEASQESPSVPLQTPMPVVDEEIASEDWPLLPVADPGNLARATTGACSSATDPAQPYSTSKPVSDDFYEASVSEPAPSGYHGRASALGSQQGFGKDPDRDMAHFAGVSAAATAVEHPETGLVRFSVETDTALDDGWADTLDLELPPDAAASMLEGQDQSMAMSAPHGAALGASAMSVQEASGVGATRVLSLVDVAIEPGPSLSEQWRAVAQLPGEWVLAGDPQRALSELEKEIALAEPAVLQPVLRALQAAARVTVPSPTPAGSALVQPHPSLRHKQSSHATCSASLIAVDALEQRLEHIFGLVTRGAFAEADRHLLSLLWVMPFAVAYSEDEEARLHSVLNTCREYRLGMRLVLEQRRCKSRGIESEEDRRRLVQLAALFTHCNLEPSHLVLALRAAMKLAYEQQFHELASRFALRILETEPSQELSAAAQRVIAYAERRRREDRTGSSSETPESRRMPPLAYDENRLFLIDADRLMPIYQGESSRSCPYCAANYTLAVRCIICQLTRLDSQPTPTGIVFHSRETAVDP
jgi:coatomer protein complex subunit alpha (xenin)